MEQGTPKDLREAVIRAIMMMPLNRAEELGPKIIKDFLAQRFAAATLKAKNTEEEALLENLWNSITEGL